ncbi:MAG: glycosyltransferase [Actinomycetota bacterium]|nr:glycosyltransferase [Actinomycetota bacterium]
MAKSREVSVAICTSRKPVPGCLEALREQVAPERLVVVASGGGEGDLVEPRPGLSHARNRALTWAADRGDELLAFVDDDAIVAAGWYEALTRRWAEAPDDVACIGGPIRPRFAADPPPWYSPRIQHVLTLLDRGPEVRDLDPHVEAVYGANISFRVEPLLRAGGFDPALGHAGERIFFGEEDEAQRALARLGHRTRYVPDAAVWHVIPPERLTRRSFVERRFAFGVALGMRGGRTRGLAARRVFADGVGAIVASDPRVRMDRAVRGAENLGVLMARRRA